MAHPFQYTTSDSVVRGLFVKTSIYADYQRLIALEFGGLIKNDYNDYLGTGKPLKSEDDLSAMASRYLYRAYDDWFVGLQAVFTNYEIVGQTLLDEQILDLLGVKGFQSGGIGAAV